MCMCEMEPSSVKSQNKFKNENEKNHPPIPKYTFASYHVPCTHIYTFFYLRKCHSSNVYFSSLQTGKFEVTPVRWNCEKQIIRFLTRWKGKSGKQWFLIFCQTYKQSQCLDEWGILEKTHFSHYPYRINAALVKSKRNVTTCNSFSQKKKCIWLKANNQK